MNRLLTLAEVAERLRMEDHKDPIRAVWRLMRRHDIIPIRRGKEALLTEADLAQLIERMKGCRLRSSAAPTRARSRSRAPSASARQASAYERARALLTAPSQKS